MQGLSISEKKAVATNSTIGRITSRSMEKRLKKLEPTVQRLTKKPVAVLSAYTSAQHTSGMNLRPLVILHWSSFFMAIAEPRMGHTVTAASNRSNLRTVSGDPSLLSRVCKFDQSRTVRKL